MMKKINLNDPLHWMILARESAYDAVAFAKICRRSTRQIDRYAHQVFGCSTQKWLNERRCLDAAALLQKSHSIKEVAFQLGYKQSSHFTRQFKAYYDVTPGEFIRLGRLPHLLSPRKKDEK
jgi:AraC-like DNA-binding protein